MLAVNGNDFSTILCSRAHHKLTGTDKRLFVGKGNPFFFVDCSQRRLEPDRAGNRCHNTITLRANGSFNQPFHPGDNPNIQILHSNAKIVCRFFVKNRNKLWMQPPGLFFEEINFPIGRECINADPRVFGYGNRLPANGTRTAKHRNRINHFLRLQTDGLSG